MLAKADTIHCRIKLSVFQATLLAMVLGAALNAPSVRAEQDSLTPGEQFTAHYTEQGAKRCLYCHSDERMQVIEKTPHGDKSNPKSPFAQHDCESCHGPGSLHATRSRRGKGRPEMNTFGKDAKTPIGNQNNICLDCHAELNKMEWKGSVHAREDVACAHCHKVHNTTEEMEDINKQKQACYSCHEKMKTEHPKFEDVGIKLEPLECWACHDVHQLIPAKKTASQQ